MAVKSPRQRFFMRSAVVLSLLVIVGFGAGIAALVKVQFVQGEKYKAKAELNQLLDESIPAQRGIIYDTNSKVLAESASVWKIYINPKRIAEINDEGMREELINKLSGILGVDTEEVRKSTYLNKLEYIEVKGKVEYAEKESIAALRNTEYKKDPNDKNEKGIPYYLVVGIRTDEKRYYPYGDLASSLIGFCGDNGGSSGIEKSYNSILTGTPGRILTVKNAENDAIPFQLETVYDAKQGTDIVLTIDEVIQRNLEKELEQVYAVSKGKGAYGIVMDVNTGAILAMANKPDYDLNAPYSLADKALSEEINKIEDITLRETETENAQYRQWNNFCTQGTYEPGSVFKIVTSSAAVEEKLWSLTETYTCHGSIIIGDRTMACHYHPGHGTQTISEALCHSCNPFFITVGQRLGVNTFFKYFEAFGFTEKTGIDTAETAPVEGETYHAKDSMGKVELASSSFGQSFEVTPIQMITATAAIANGGKLMRPFIVAKELDAAGNVVSATQPYVRRQVISATTSATVTKMMESVVSSGSGKNAYVPGYRVAGKTGTSEKLGKADAYVASFSCFAPANDPKIAVLIMVDESVNQIGGGQIAAPVAGEIVESTLKYMNVEPVYNQDELTMLNTSAPNLAGIGIDEAAAQVKELHLSVKIIGTGEKVISQTPAFGRSLPKNGIVALYTDEGVNTIKTKVPDFTNMNITQVYKSAVSAGINIKVTGNILKIGELISYKQNVDAAAEVDYGSEVTVYFKSNTVTSEIG